VLLQRVDQEPTGRRGDGRLPRHRVRDRDVGREVEQDGGDVDTGDAVDEGVMGLLDEGDVAALQAFDEPQLPQGPAPVEQLGLEPLEQGEELGPVAGAGERRQAHVVGDVEAIVVDPDRVPGVQRHVLQPLTEPWDAMQPRRDEIADRADPESSFGGEERLALEDGQRADVHRGLEALEVQEAGVERAQPVVSHPGRLRAAR